ncbi:hypothetical protein C6I20_03140 [Aeromicrobium sp. A1-2]|uniref:hypothetical protein n=1 Tax=Aeromicrobium sp. A1-2 TaxID=2107713 RepID=UPI000E5031B6|nr:hypothetical protein [Aeromicrobium sp. A1-2]AXT84286.1 hypothetical protein C6I20_03140 [Aeromicrobium sp. A1-2]
MDSEKFTAPPDAGDGQRFSFAWEPRYRLPAFAFGLTPRTAWVEVTGSELHVRYGFWSLRSALSNITGVEVSGPYAFLKTAGPAHLSMSDRGITFATNSREGLCMTFREPVPGIDPTKRIKHPGATLTVSDVAGLSRTLGFPRSVGSP